MQLADQHGCSPQAVKPGQLRPVARLALFTAEHPYLPGGIAELHDMAAAMKAGRRAAKIKLDKMITPAAERQKKSGCIQQKQIAGAYRAGQQLIVQRITLVPFDDDPQFADRTPPGLHCADQANLMTDQLPSNHL